MSASSKIATGSADYEPLGADPYGGHQILIRHCRSARFILDVGCSAGVMARELVAAGAVVDGVEQDPVAAAEAATVCRRVVVGDVETVSLDFEKGAYDVVLMGDLIEHTRDPVRLMAAFRPLLKADGRLLLSTPNVANWSLRLHLLAGRWDYTRRGLLDRTHVHLFTLRTLKAAIREAGYEIAFVDVTCPLPVLRRAPFNRIAHDLAKIWKRVLAYQFVVGAGPL